MKICSRCKESKPLDQFYKHKRAKDGYCSYCIVCDKKAKAEYYLRTREETIARAARWSQENREKTREYKRNWKRKNPDALRQYKQKRRALERGCSEHFTKEEWQALVALYEGKCLRCGSTENLSADHVIPLALGGSNSIDNIQPLCVGCNCWKNTKVIDFREI